MFFLRYILTISKHIFFEKLNENNFYMKIVDLDEIYSFLILSFLFEVVKILKKISKGIFDFSHPRFDTVRA